MYRLRPFRTCYRHANVHIITFFFGGGNLRGASDFNTELFAVITPVFWTYLFQVRQHKSFAKFLSVLRLTTMSTNVGQKIPSVQNVRNGPAQESKKVTFSTPRKKTSSYGPVWCPIGPLSGTMRSGGQRGSVKKMVLLFIIIIF